MATKFSRIHLFLLVVCTPSIVCLRAGIQEHLPIQNSWQSVESRDGSGVADVHNVPCEQIHLGCGSASAAHSPTAGEIVFVDSTLDHVESLVEAVSQGAEVVLLNRTGDELNQITETIRSRRNLRAIHLISHGEPGALQLGASRIDAMTLVQNRVSLAEWRDAFGTGADLLIYGCDVGLGVVGTDFAAKFAKLTGLDVAVSSGRTGDSELGGDWELEVQTGSIESQLPFVSGWAYAGILPVTRTEGYQHSLWVRPGAASYTWSFGTYTDGNGLTSTITQAAYANVPDSGFGWILNRGIFQYSTNGGGNWNNYTVNNSSSAVYVPTAGTLFRFVDQSPGDTTNGDRVGHYLQTTAYPVGGSGTSIHLDNAPSDIISDRSAVLDDVIVGGLVANLSPQDTGLTRGGHWGIDTQSVSSLFTVQYDNTANNKAVLRKGSGSFPAVGETVTVTVRYFDPYQTDDLGDPIPGEGFSKELSFTVLSNSTNDLNFNDEVLANAYTTESQSYPAITTLSNGNYVVVWESEGQGGKVDADYSGVYGQIFDATGARVGSEFVVSNSSSTSDERHASVTALNDGRFAVSYNSWNGSDYDIGVRIVEANGAVGSEITANTATAGNQYYPSSATLTDGSFVVVWVNYDTGDIRLQQFAADSGTKMGAEVSIIDADGWYPGVAALSNGDYVVSWNSYNFGEFYFKVGAGGTATGTGIGDGSYAGPGRIAALADGFVIVGDPYDGGTGRYMIEAARFTNAGVAQGAPFAVNSHADGNRYVPGITTLSNGGFVVVWQSDTDDFIDGGIFGRRYDASGTAVDAEEFQVNQYRSGDQGYPVVTGLAGDLFATAWMDADASSGESNIETRVLLSSGGVSAPTLAATPTSSLVTGNGATLGGNVTNDGGEAITERGVVYAVTSTNSNPEIGGTGVFKASTSGTTGVFNVEVGSLSPGTSYSFKAYATNGIDTSYSDAGTFTTMAAAPEIVVYAGNGTGGLEKVDNEGTTGFGGVDVSSGSAVRAFTIQNTGTLDLTGIAVTSNNPTEFAVAGPGVSTLAPGDTTTFTVTFDPSSSGVRNGVIEIASNDADENPFEIHVSGAGAVANDILVSVQNREVLLTLSNLGATISNLSTGLSDGNNTLKITATTTGTIYLLGAPAGVSVGNNPDIITVDLTVFSSFAGVSVEGGAGNDVVTIGAGGIDLTAANGALDQSIIVNLGGEGMGTDAVTVSNPIVSKGDGSISITVSKNIAISADVTTSGSGNITLLANQQATSPTGAFTGVSIAGVGVDVTTGGGSILVNAKGGGPTGSNRGVLVSGGAMIRPGGTGSVSVTGRGGLSTNSNNDGVLIQNAGSKITANNGPVEVIGYAGGTGSGSGYNFGVHLNSSGAGIGNDGTSAEATVNVTGYGGTGGQESQFGVDVQSSITSSRGDITVTGTGGTAASAIYNTGMLLRVAGSIRAGGNSTIGYGNVTVTGIGGPGSSSSNNGIEMQQTSSITSVGGSVSVSGVSTTGAGIYIRGSNNVISAGNDANLSIATNWLLVSSPSIATFSAGLGTATFTTPLGSNNVISLGGSSNVTTLGLPDALLDRVVAGTLVVGDSTNTGGIAVSAPITRSSATHVQLVTGSVSDSAILFGNDASVDAFVGGTVTYTAGVGGRIRLSGTGTQKLGSVTSNSPVSFAGGRVEVSIAGLTPGSGVGEHGQLAVTGTVDLGTTTALVLSGTHIPALGETWVLISNDGSDAVVGQFDGLADGGVIGDFLGSGRSAVIRYSGGDGNDVTLTYGSPEITVFDGEGTDGAERTDGIGEVDFGIVPVGNSSAPRSFTIRNDGDSNLTIGTVVPVGLNAGDFVVNTTGMLTNLAPTQSTTFSVTYTPGGTGGRAAILQIGNNDANENPFDIALKGSDGSPTVTVSTGELAKSDGSGAQVNGEPVGTTYYQFNGAQAINESGASAATAILRDSGGGLSHALVAGSPPQVIASSTTDLSGTGLPVGTTPLNFRDPLINSEGHVAYIGDIQGPGFGSANRRCLFTNVPDGVLKLVMRQTALDGTTGANFKSPAAFSLAGRSLIFLAQTDDNRTGLYAWDNVNGVRLLARTGQSVLAGGTSKTISQILGLQTNEASSGQSEEHVKTMGDEVRICVMLKFTDNSWGLFKGGYNQVTSTFSGFASTYVESGRLVDAHAGANAVLPNARMNVFGSPGWDQTGEFFGLTTYMLSNLGGVKSFSDSGVLVDLDPGELVLQVRENEVAPGAGGVAVFKDFYDVMVGGGDWEFLVRADIRGGPVTTANNDGLWAKHATNGLTLVAREGDEPPGVTGGAFKQFVKYALPGNGAPFFGAFLTTGVGGVTVANDAGVWAVNSVGELKKVIREGDVINVGGMDRTVQTITSLESTSSGAVGSRIYTSNGRMKLLVKFTDGLQSMVDVAVP